MLSDKSSSVGRVDGFNQDQAASKCDEGTVALGSLFASQGNALEAFQFAHRLLDAGSGFVERFRKNVGRSLAFDLCGITGAMPRLRQAARLVAEVIAFVGQRRPRRDVGADAERGFQLGAVADLAAGQMEGDGQAVKIRLEVDFAREAPP